jgi:hypothetical protein
VRTRPDREGRNLGRALERELAELGAGENELGAQGLLQVRRHDPRGSCHGHGLILGRNRDELKRKTSFVCSAF